MKSPRESQMSGWWEGWSKTHKIREIALLCFFLSKKEDEIIFGLEIN
jgi:hypothetical protein